MTRSLTGAVQRSACDACRQRKCKCNGEKPFCSRCAYLGLECVYSAKRPMGRPTRRRLTPPLTPTRSSLADQRSLIAPVIDSNTSSLLSPSSTTSGSDILDIDPIPLTSIDTRPEHQSTTADHSRSPVPSVINTVSSTATEGLFPDSSPSCSCLASFYLTMDDLCKNTNLVFPSGLNFLRDRIATATQLAHCQICPTQYLPAMQNTQLLGTLLMSLAKQYAVVLDSIDKEKDHLALNNKLKYLHFGLSPARLDSRTITESDLNYAIEVSPSEWAKFARRAVEREVYGSNDKQESLWDLVDFVERRQEQWHDVQPKPDCSQGHLSGQEPLCLKIMHGVKERVGSLKFD